MMRRAMSGLLPDEVSWRSSKANLAPNFKRRLYEQDRKLLDEVILGPPGGLEEYVDTSALRRAYERYLGAPMADDNALTVYGSVVLALWLQRTKIVT